MAMETKYGYGGGMEEERSLQFPRVIHLKIALGMKNSKESS